MITRRDFIKGMGNVIAIAGILLFLSALMPPGYILTACVGLFIFVIGFNIASSQEDTP
jgi:uncharacterized membrane protein